MNKEKWYEKLKTRGQSITVPMTLLMIAVAVIPLLLQTWILIGSFKQNQIEARSIEIQNQCVILSNRMTRSGYLTADKTNNVSLVPRCRRSQICITDVLLSSTAVIRS